MENSKNSIIVGVVSFMLAVVLTAMVCNIAFQESEINRLKKENAELCRDIDDLRVKQMQKDNEITMYKRLEPSYQRLVVK